MKVIDLTHALHPEIPLYPGDNPPSLQALASVEQEGYAVSRVCFDSHTGTHLDAPAHMLAEGASLEVMPADAFTGSACVLDFRAHGQPEIGLGHIQAKAQHMQGCDFALLRTGWEEYWNTPQYVEDYPVLSLEAAQWLAEANLKGIGLDCISPDVVKSEEFPVHKALLSQGILVVENLCNLDELPELGFLFCAFPLKIKNGDGCPVRAVGLIP